MREIRSCTTHELEAEPNLASLLSEYALESSLPELGPASAQIDTYHMLETAGALRPVGAFVDGRLAGFILPLTCVLPHYGVMAATVESFFVSQAERKKGIGLQLLKHASELATESGAKALLVSAPKDSALSRVLPRLGFRHSNDVFIKAL